jgi:PAS domain S-box-containing protein
VGETERLKRCINDLISVLALPAIWTGSDPTHVLSTLLEALRGMLGLDLVYARMNGPPGEAPIEVVRVAGADTFTVQAHEIGVMLDERLGADPRNWPLVTRNVIDGAEVSIVAMPLGLQWEIGALIAGSGRADFPRETERLVLGVAANQAAIGLREARLLSDQKRLAIELDQRVARRTAELTAANQGLRKEVAERRRAEEHLRAIETNLREIVDSVPGLVCTMNAAGEVEHFNRRVLEYFGKSPAELKYWATGDAVHPDDLPRVIAAFTSAITTGSPYSMEHRCRRADGVYRWFQVRALPVRDTDAGITGWYVLLTDIDDLKRAEEAIRASEHNLQLIINTIPALAWSARLDGSAEFFNQHYLDYVGLSAEQAQDWDWATAVHPDDRDGLFATWQAIMASGSPGEGEARLRRSDGEYRWFLFRANPFRDENGHIVKWYGINTDIEALRQSELNLRQMTETIPEMLWSATSDGAIDYCNARLLDYTGCSAEAVMGSGWTTLLHPDDVEQTAREWISCVTTGAPYRVEVRIFHRADGTYRWCVTNARPLLDQQGRILKWHGTVVDMHDWKQAQEALRDTQAELAHMTRVMTMGELTAAIAHEINQPLSGIITNASTSLRMLAGDPPNVDGALETARRTIRDANRVSDVITRLRELYTKKEAAAESVDLNEATREVIALSLGVVQKDGVIPRTELAADLPRVTGDRVQLQQVVLNLVRNALDAMSAVEGRPKELLIRTGRDEGDRVLLTVRDTGVGFQRESADRLFDPFYTTKTSGMGIGLSVSRSIIESHHGRLWATLNDGPGATFSFSIPCEPVGTRVESLVSSP